MPYRTVTEATKAINTALQKPLKSDAAVELWVNIQGVNLSNHGSLLYELFLAHPVQIPNPHACALLSYLRDSGTGFEKVIDFVEPEILFRNHGPYNIPPALLTPLILKDPGKLIRWVEQYPTLYTEGLRDALLVHCKNLNRRGVQKLCLEASGFWESARGELLPLMIRQIGMSNVENAFEEGSQLFTVEEREMILAGLLSQAIDTSRDGYSPENLRTLHKLSRTYLPKESHEAFQRVLREKVEELIKTEEPKDPVTAFLSGEMPWKEMVFAKTSPEEYQKYKNQDRYGPEWFPPPGLFFRRPWGWG